MSKIIDLAKVRRRKAREAQQARGEAWDDDSASVHIDHNPDYPNSPVVRTETSDFTVEVGLTPEEARVFACRLLNIANCPRGVQMRGHSEGEDP